MDTDGHIYYSMNHGTTNWDIMLLFLSHLARKLNQESPGWLENTVILLDGARYHTSDETRDNLKKMGYNVIFSAPYSYSAAPIELLFGGIKKGQLYPFDQPTGKKYVPCS